MVKTKTYKIRVLNKDENATEKILDSSESSQFAIINSESFSLGTLYYVASSKSSMDNLKRKFKNNKIKAIVKLN